MFLIQFSSNQAAVSRWFKPQSPGGSLFSHVPKQNLSLYTEQGALGNGLEEERHGKSFSLGPSAFILLFALFVKMQLTLGMKSLYLWGLMALIHGL